MIMKKLLLTSLLLVSFAGLALAQTNKAEQEVLKADQEWMEAALKSDVAKLDALFADTIVYTHTSGKVDNKASYLAPLKAGDVKYLSLERDDIKVQVHGDAAIVTAHWQVKVSNKGNVSQTNARYVHVYVRQKGRWRMLVHQSTRLEP